MQETAYAAPPSIHRCRVCLRQLKTATQSEATLAVVFELRQYKAKSILQLEILAQPPKKRPTDIPWTAAPMLLKTTSSHEEGCRTWIQS